MSASDDNDLKPSLSGEETVAFHGFYRSRLGRMTRHLITRKLQVVFDEAKPPSDDPRVAVGLGYARPYLRFLEGKFGQAIGLQSAGIEAVQWPRKRPSRLALIDETALPVQPSSIDTMLCVHALEIAPSQPALLEECWRVLKSQARLVLVVPHRGSMWAGREITPFGYGQPYTVNQIKSMLKRHGFEVGKVHQSLAAPPSHSLFYPRFAPIVERLPNPLGGVLIVDARKMIYSVRGIPVAARKLVRPALVGMNSSMVPGAGGPARRERSETKGQ